MRLGGDRTAVRRAVGLEAALRRAIRVMTGRSGIFGRDMQHLLRVLRAGMSFWGAGQERKLLKSVTVQYFDRPAQFSFAEQSPLLRPGAIELSRSGPTSRLCREVNSKTGSAHTMHVNQHGANEFFPSRQGKIKHDVHDAAGDHIVRRLRCAAACDKAYSCITAVTPPGAAHHFRRQVDSQIFEIGAATLLGEEGRQRTVTAAQVNQGNRPVGGTNSQKLDEAQPLRRRA